MRASTILMALAGSAVLAAPVQRPVENGAGNDLAGKRSLTTMYDTYAKRAEDNSNPYINNVQIKRAEDSAQEAECQDGPIFRQCTHPWGPGGYGID